MAKDLRSPLFLCDLEDKGDQSGEEVGGFLIEFRRKMRFRLSVVGEHDRRPLVKDGIIFVFCLLE